MADVYEEIFGIQCASLYFLVLISRRRYRNVVKASARVDKYSKSDIIVSPSILSANFAKLGEQVLFCALIFPSFLFVMLCASK